MPYKVSLLGQDSNEVFTETELIYHRRKQTISETRTVQQKILTPGQRTGCTDIDSPVAKTQS